MPNENEFKSKMGLTEAGGFVILRPVVEDALATDAMVFAGGIGADALFVVEFLVRAGLASVASGRLGGAGESAG